MLALIYIYFTSLALVLISTYLSFKYPKYAHITLVTKKENITQALVIAVIPVLNSFWVCYDISLIAYYFIRNPLSKLRRKLEGMLDVDHLD